jgi:hypothetical protein
VPHRYSAPNSFCCPVRSLLPPRALPGAPPRYRHPLSHVPCRSRRSGSRRLHAGHRLASKRAPARLIPELCTHPGSDAISCFSTLHQRFTHVRLPDPHLTTLTPPFPSSLTTTVFSQGRMRRFDITPRRATPKGHKTFISYIALPPEGLPTTSPLSAFVAHMQEQVSHHG